MYVIKRILVTSGRLVHLMDVSDDKVVDLLKRYSSIKVIMSHAEQGVLVIGELQDNQFISDYNGTINELIRTNQISKLELSVYDEQEGVKFLFKTDLWERGFDVEPFDLFGHHEFSEPEMYPDMKLTNDFIDSATLARTHMLSVNGLIHPLVSDTEGSYAIGANTNCRATGELELSLLEWRGVGDIDLISLGCDNRVDIHQEGDIHQNGIYIKLGHEYKDKVLGVVILGHLHLLDGTYHHFDKDIIHISLKTLDLETKIINHHAALGMTNVDNYLKGGLGKVDLRNPSLIDYVLNNKSTFMFALDVDVAYRLERPLNDEGLPCLYSTPTGLTGIAQYADGLMADYRQEFQDGLYCLQVPKRPRSDLLMKTTNASQQQAGSRGALPNISNEAPLLMAVEYLKLK